MKGCWFQDEVKIKEEETMKDDTENTIKTKKVFLTGFNATEDPE